MRHRSITSYRVFGIAYAIVSLFFVVSCEDEMESSSRSGIQFSPDFQPVVAPLTKGDLPAASVTEVRAEGLGALYLHTLYADSIAPSLPADREPHNLPLTKAAPVDEMYDNFSVSACSYSGDWNGLQDPNFMYDVTVSQAGIPASNYYWPGASYKLRFFAFAPKGETAYRLSEATAGIPTLRCTVPADVAEQKDLLVASSAEIAGDASSPVPLYFHHALTAVTFVCGKDVKAGTVKSVTLKNVYSKGNLDLNLETWSGWGTKASFSQTLNKATTANSVITEGAQTFMMIPQTLPDDAVIEVVFNDGTDHTLTAPIAGEEWPKGKTVIYKLSTSSINWEYTFEVTTPESFDYSGGTDTFQITSYRTNGKGDKEPVAWTAEFSEDGQDWSGNKPDWIDMVTSGEGGETSTSYNIVVKEQMSVADPNHASAMRKIPEVGTAAKPYNLSNATGDALVENTANCYVVNAPGVYSFPLVYGNAIKNGADNANAYSTDVQSSGGLKVLNRFINHLGNGITDPYIENNEGCEPDHAELIWQDARSLLTDIQYTAGANKGEGTISFKVDKSSIQQGNALIAIKDQQGQVMWSWHIWVTDEDVNSTVAVKNNAGVTYNFMRVNLGWCEGDMATFFPGRSCKIRLVAGDETKEFEIAQTQGGNLSNGSGNQPYYRWGRKDPFPPAIPLKEPRKNKPWYNANGEESTASPKLMDLSPNDIQNEILHPEVIDVRQRREGYMNLWDANNNKILVSTYTGLPSDPSFDKPTVKTIYDPSPVGFKIPEGNAYTGFTRTGSRATGTAVNGVWDQKQYGYYFYAEPNKTGEQIFFPAAGVRFAENGSGYPGSPNGYYWVAIPGGNTGNGYLRFMGNGTIDVTPVMSASVDNGNPDVIRCVRDDR